MLNQQHMADNLKAVAARLPFPTHRKIGMKCVKQIEMAEHWLPDEFEKAVEATKGAFVIEGKDLICKMPISNALPGIETLTNTYMAALEPTQPTQPEA